MTAVLCLLQSSTGFLFSDAAVFAPDGTIVAVGGKLILLPHAKVAIVARGLVPSGRWPAELFQLPSLEDVVTRLPDLAAWLAERASELPHPGEYPEQLRTVELAMVGWSEQAGEVQSWGLATAHGNGPAQALPNFAPMVPSRAPHLWGGPSADVEQALGRPIRTLPDLDELDAPAAGAAILQAMRARPGRLPDGSLCHAVGGYAEMASVDARGVRRQLIMAWPDKIGERVSADNLMGERVG